MKNKIKTFVDFAGNDYLGLAKRPELALASAAAAKKYGISSTSSRWAVGWSDLHARYEETVARFIRRPAACILNSTYLGGLAYYFIMAGRGCTAVVCDETVHSNQFFGMKAAGLKIITFRHMDVADCKRKLKAVRNTGRAIVATDAVYGISGELAPVGELARVAEKAGAEFFVDDAHGFGVYGASGRGMLDRDKVKYEKTVILASMSKAFGCNGGFLAGRADLIDAIRHSPVCSGTAIPPACIAAACLKSFELFDREPGLRKKLFDHIRVMHGHLARRGIPVVDKRSSIVAMALKDEFEAAALSRHFLEYGLRIPYFKYASEPRENLLRAVGRACYTRDDLARFGEALSTADFIRA